MEEKLKIEHKLKQAEEFEANGKFLHAIQVYTSLIEQYPQLTEAIFCLADLYQKLNNINSASSLISLMIENDPDNIEKRMFAGQFFLKNSLWNEAIDVLELVMAEEDGYVSYLRGFAYYKLNEFELSKINFLNYVIRETDSSLKHEGYLFLAKNCIELKDYHSAENFLKKIESVYSSYWEYQYLFGLVYKNIGMLEHAIVCAEKAIKLNSKNAEAFALAGQLQLISGDYKKAERRFYKCLELKDDFSADIYTGLAEVCLKSDNLKEALAYYNTALKLDPQNNTAQKGKAAAEHKLNNVSSDG
ncbi:MAG: tetratricopeptide repeat protein [Ignavibacteriales bacterium]|nr:MAG: tetratricopeptide repeat protein [Ignavibacteriales bacterium]